MALLSIHQYTPVTVLHPLYLTSPSDPEKFPGFPDGEAAAWRLNYLPKATQLSKQQSQDSNTKRSNYSKSQTYSGRREGRKEKTIWLMVTTTPWKLWGTYAVSCEPVVPLLWNSSPAPREAAQSLFLTLPSFQHKTGNSDVVLKNVIVSTQNKYLNSPLIQLLVPRLSLMPWQQLEAAKRWVLLYHPVPSTGFHTDKVLWFNR